MEIKSKNSMREKLKEIITIENWKQNKERMDNKILNESRKRKRL